MSRYFFHVHDGVSLPDRGGEELLNLEEAKRRAVQIAGKLLLDRPELFWEGEEWSLDCCDNTDLILFSLHFLASMSPAGGAIKGGA